MAASASSGPGVPLGSCWAGSAREQAGRRAAARTRLLERRKRVAYELALSVLCEPLAGPINLRVEQKVRVSSARAYGSGIMLTVGVTVPSCATCPLVSGRADQRRTGPRPRRGKSSTQRRCRSPRRSSIGKGRPSPPKRDNVAADRPGGKEGFKRRLHRRFDLRSGLIDRLIKPNRVRDRDRDPCRRRDRRRDTQRRCSTD